MVGAAAVSVVGGYLTSKSNKKSNQQVAQANAAQDPYGPYRAAAAKRLDALMSNPDTITDTPEYKARLQASSRLMAAQGYTGSGNALIEAANAGGDAFQQAFNNLSILSGAGQPPAPGAMQGAAISSSNNQSAMNSYGQIANGLVASGIGAYNNYKQNQFWNTPIMSNADITNNMNSSISQDFAPNTIDLS